jgi:hypothetical protein
MNERSKCAAMGGRPPLGGGSAGWLPHTLSLANGVTVWMLITELRVFESTAMELETRTPPRSRPQSQSKLLRGAVMFPPSSCSTAGQDERRHVGGHADGHEQPASQLSRAERMGKPAINGHTNSGQGPCCCDKGSGCPTPRRRDEPSDLRRVPVVMPFVATLVVSVVVTHRRGRRPLGMKQCR